MIAVAAGVEGGVQGGVLGGAQDLGADLGADLTSIDGVNLWPALLDSSLPLPRSEV